MGCYIITCIIQRLIETVLTKQQNSLLLDTVEHESQWMSAEFEEKSLDKEKGGNCENKQVIFSVKKQFR